MTRTPKGRARPSPNGSYLTNSSILEDPDKTADLTYSEFIKRFRTPQLEQNEPIGFKEIVDNLKRRFELLLGSNEQDFALISGPPGTGKTMFVRKLVAQYPSINFLYFKAPWAIDRRFTSPESRIGALFEEAIQKAPSLIFIDQLDSICAKKPQNDLKERLLNVLEDELANLQANSEQVLVFAASNQPDSINSHIMERFFSDEIKFTLPRKQDRVEMLKSFLANHENNLSEEQLEKVAEDSHCYRYCDLRRLYRIAAEHSKGSLDHESFKFALTQFKPLLIAGLTTPCPPTKWDDIGGNEIVKQELHKSIIQPLQYKAKFKNRRSNRGALLYGPSGCSKTMLARALATESGYNFISIRGPQLYSKYVGDSEAAVRKLYSDARAIAPCIIFFDEIDGFVPERNDNQGSCVGDKMVTQLLAELDGVQPLDNVFTIAATNRPQKLDSALLRPGRLYPHIYIPLPTESDRRAIFKVHARRLDLLLDEPLLDQLVLKTHNYSGAEISIICEIADEISSSEEASIEWRHFEEALLKVRPKTIIGQVKDYEEFQGGDRYVRTKNNNCVEQDVRKATSLLTRLRSMSIRRAK